MNAATTSPATTCLFLTIALIMATQGCMPSIWNASDLADWVRDQAVEQGCQNDSITLEEWYRETEHGNSWHGSCVDSSGATMAFAINVDPVWAPSES
jgi:hypothetical protein